MKLGFFTAIFHVHAKDLRIDHEGLYQNGITSLGIGWEVPVLPGLGDVRWDKLIFLISRDVLRPFIH